MQRAPRAHTFVERIINRAYRRAVEATVWWLTPKRLALYPATVGVLSVLTWVVSQFIGPGLVDASSTIIGSDFSAFYTGGRFLLDGRMSELYDFGAQRAFQAALIAPIQTAMMSPFINPPFAAVLYLPFALGTYATGLMLWWVTGLLSLAASFDLLRRELGLPRASTGRWLALSFTFFPTLAWFVYGQATAFTLLIYTATYVLLRRRRDVAAGFVLGLLLYKPQLALALGLMLVAERRWRAVLGGAVSVGLWLAIGFAISPDAMEGYGEVSPFLFDLLRSGMDPRFGLRSAYPTWGVHSLFGFATLLLDGLWPSGASALAGALTIAGLLLVVAWWRSIQWVPGTRSWDLTFAATVAMGLLISPHLFVYDLMLLLLPLLILWSHHAEGDLDRPLDGGPLLAWTAWMYVVTFVGSYFTLSQLALSAVFGLPRAGLQLSVIIIAGWAWMIARDGQRGVRSSGVRSSGVQRPGGTNPHTRTLQVATAGALNAGTDGNAS